MVAFGEEYQSMTDREILIELATEQRLMKAQLERIHCPSPNCNLHEQRLSSLEQDRENRKDSQLSLQAWVTIMTAILMGGMALILQVYDMWRK